MRQRGAGFHCISDREVDRIRDLGAEGLTRAPGDSAAGAFMKGLDGRHRFWMHPTEAVLPTLQPAEDHAARRYATLRVDHVNGLISGDVFGDIGRRDWQFSWRSEAVFGKTDNTPSDGDWDLLAICDFFRSGSYTPQLTGFRTLPEKIAVLLKTGADMSLVGVRLIAVDDAGNVTDDLTMTDAAPLQRFDTFRRVRIINVTDIAEGSESLAARILDRAIGFDGAVLRKVLSETGARLYWEHTEEFRHVGTDAATPFEALAPYQWNDDPYSYAILVSERLTGGAGILGTTFGLDGNDPKVRARSSAVIFIKKIVESYRLAHGLSPDDDLEDHIDALATRVRVAYIHEFGHLLNLPHCWQWDLFRTPALEAEPAARTWMNYGSRYPLGDFSRMLRRKAVEREAAGQNLDIAAQRERETALAREDSERNLSAGLAQPGFSHAEHRWIWHAPFDHIASGGEYFTRRFEVDYRLSDQSVSDQLKLSIWDATPGEDDIQILRKAPADGLSKQPLCGEVTFTATRKFAAGHPIHMSFQSPMLSILVRNASERGRQADRPRETRRFPVVWMPVDWTRKDPDTGETKPVDLAAALNRAALNPVADDGETLTFRTTLPLITGDFFDGFDGDWKDDFTLQAVLRPYGSIPIFSNQVRVRFSRAGQAYSEAEKQVIANENLPLLVATLSALVDAPIQELSLPSRHTGRPDPPVFEDLVARIEALDRGGLSGTLLNHCAARARPPDIGGA